MNCRYLVSITAALALLAAACSSGSSYSSGYGSSSYSGGYEAGTAGTPSASATPGTSSSTGGSESLSNDIHGLMHAEKQDERIKRAEKTEALLGPAGFKLMPIDTPAKHKVIEGLSPLSFNRLAHHGKIHYWFADPYWPTCATSRPSRNASRRRSKRPISSTPKIRSTCRWIRSGIRCRRLGCRRRIR
jgi:hypothetical protein